MSVIGNALKAAQREKQKRTGGGGAPPLIIPLKSRSASSGFSWRRALALIIGGSAVFGATALTVKFVKGDTRPAAVLQPVILGDVPAATPAPANPSPDSTKRVAVVTPPAPPRQTPPTASRAPRRVASASAPTTTTKLEAPAKQQSASSDSATAGLRITVDQPREEAYRLFQAGVAAHRAGDLAYARVAYERVLTMAPSDVDAMNNLGILLSAQRDFAAAERLLRRASALAPRNAGVWNNLGTVLRERGQSADAIAAFQHALAIDSTHLSARVSLAQQYLAIGSLPKARELLEHVVTANPAVPEAQYTLGQVLELQGDRAGAIRAYQAFVGIAPGRFATHIDFVRRHLADLTGRVP